MAVLKVPKTVKWAEIRALIGDQRTEDIITLRYGPSLLGPPVIHIRKNVLENMLAHMEGREVPGAPRGQYYQAIPAIFRLYYRESPQAKGRFKRWLRAKIASAAEANESEVAEAAGQMAQDTVTQTPRKRRVVAKKRQKVSA